jgi:hypothetical protein
MALFRKSEEKAAAEAATQAEFDRLCALPVPELAATVMSAFADGGPGHGKTLGLLQIQSWLMASFSHSTGYVARLREPVLEAIQALDHAQLAQRTGPHNDVVSTTRLGEQALAEGSVRQQLSA